MTDICIIINAHREGAMAIPSIRSAINAANHARNNGITCEIIAVLDSSDHETEAIFNSQKDISQIHKINIGDAASARNYGVQKSSSEYIAFKDADDLWKQDWLTLAHKHANSVTEAAIFHPEYNIYFEGASRITEHKPSTTIPTSTLAFDNGWTSASFGPRTIYKQISYPPKEHSRQIGYEDWGWNLKVLQAGYQHLVVPGTAHLIRVKKHSFSLSRSESSINCYPERCTLFKSNAVSATE